MCKHTMCMSLVPPVCRGVRHPSHDALPDVPWEQLRFWRERAERAGAAVLQNPAGHPGAFTGLQEPLHTHPSQWLVLHLFVRPSICLSLFYILSVCVCPSVCPSVCLCLFLSVCVCLSVCLSVCLCLFLSVCVCPSVCPSVCLCLFLSVCVCLLVCLTCCHSFFVSFYPMVYQRKADTWPNTSSCRRAWGWPSFPVQDHPQPPAAAGEGGVLSDPAPPARCWPYIGTCPAWGGPPVQWCTNERRSGTHDQPGPAQVSQGPCRDLRWVAFMCRLWEK